MSAPPWSLPHWISKFLYCLPLLLFSPAQVSALGASGVGVEAMALEEAMGLGEAPAREPENLAVQMESLGTRLLAALLG
jgi:hypothetical protein